MTLKMFSKPIGLIATAFCLYSASARAELIAYSCQTHGSAWSNSERYAGDSLPKAMKFHLFIDDGKVIQVDRSRVYQFEEYRPFVDYYADHNKLAEAQQRIAERALTKPIRPTSPWDPVVDSANFERYARNNINGDPAINSSSPPFIVMNCTLAENVTDRDPYLVLQFDQPKVTGDHLQGLYYNKRIGITSIKMRVEGLYGVHRSSTLSVGTGSFSCDRSESIVRPDLAPENNQICHRFDDDVVPSINCSDANAVRSARDQLLRDLQAKHAELTQLAFRNFSGFSGSIRGVATRFESRLDRIVPCLNDQEKEELIRWTRGLIEGTRQYEQMSQSILR